MSLKLTIRDWQTDDMEQIAAMHDRMGLGYPLPASFGPLFCVRKAIVDESGTIVAAATLKLTSEAYLWLNPDHSVLKRAKSVKMLNEECHEVARNLGLEDCSAWIPPKIARCFAKTLRKLGWRKSPWRNWSILLD